MSKTTATELAARMQAEIQEDAKNEVIPSEIWEFGDLHHYVDANKYGGLCDDERLEALIAEHGGREDDGSLPSSLVNLITEAEGIVGRWLEEGGLAGEPLHDAEITPGPWGQCAALSSDLAHIRYISGPDAQRVAKVEIPKGMSQKEAMANAKAITLVPEMVHLVKEAARMLKEHPEYASGSTKVHYLAAKFGGLVNALK